MTKTRLAVIAALAVTLAACGKSPTEPSENNRGGGTFPNIRVQKALPAAANQVEGTRGYAERL